MKRTGLRWSFACARCARRLHSLPVPRPAPGSTGRRARPRASDIRTSSRASEAAMLNDPDVVRVLLARLIAARCPIFVFIEGDDERFATVLLEIDVAARVLIADELIPKHGHKRMRRGAKLKISSRLDGVEVRFRSAVREVDADSQLSAYMLDLPDALDYREQRASKRTRTFEVTAELRDEQGAPVPARVLDLSIEGM